MFGAAVAGFASAIYALQVAKREEELIFGLPQEMQASAMEELRERRAERERKATEERRHRRDGSGH